MSRQKDKSGFGVKGKDDLARSFGEMLLSGRALEKRKSPHIKLEPKLKPRAKASFGRKDGAPGTSVREPQGGSGQRWLRLPNLFKRRSWKTLVVWGFAIALAVQAMALVFNVPVPTLGGRQLWTDVRISDGWRVQCHAWTGHCRLLDRHNLRHDWGREDEMLAALDTMVAQGRIQAPRPDAVVLVHGLGRSAHSLDKMAEELRAQGFEAVQFNYASTQGAIADHARALNRVLDGLKGVRTVSFVTHSLGGPVVRQALEQNKQDFEVGRVVMLAPPNQGSHVARTLSQYAFFRTLLGPALTDLASPSMQVLAKPPSPFAVIAGRVSVLSGDGDGVVDIEETKLKHMSKHLVVPASHTFIMDHPDVISFSVDFIGAVRKHAIETQKAQNEGHKT
ncbi:esterase/lipase family protein [Magnetovibrio sp.]|uniref:esterase/lipase family protein n=1 Tax=Magnetovibrio sp. TaxID=2024836 RepID=UPI002F91DE68